jgi:recombination protein RecR
MVLHVPSLERLVHELAKLPGIGPKSAQRLAYHLLKTSSENVEALRDALQNVQAKIRVCPNCFSFTENQGLCFFCEDPKRHDDVLCVVEDPSDIIRVESSGAFRGRYHVLQGAISPLDGVSADDLKIQALLDKIADSQKGLRPEIKEVILALDADLEGDTTVLYLARALRDCGGQGRIKMTRIAHGVPFGGDIDYVDYRTLGRAIENRVQL